MSEACVNLADCVKNKTMSMAMMPAYKCHKEVHATPMTRGTYNNVRGWIIPEDENPNEEGYLVVYNRGTEDEYVSWSPKHVFDDGYHVLPDGYLQHGKCHEGQGESKQKVKNMNYGEAIAAMKAGKKVSRVGWNGANMFAYYVPGGNYQAQTDLIKGIFDNDLVPYRPYLALKTAQGDIATWSASTSDQLAEDWFIVE